MPTFSSLLQDFHDYAQGRLGDFTGREWLVEKVRAWLGQADAPPFLLILGEPGIGKSAFAAHLWRDHGLPHAVHFCIAERNGTIGPLSFVESLNQQLKDNLPGFAEAFRQVQQERYEDARRQTHVEAQVQTGNVAPGGEVIGVKIIQQIGDLQPEEALDFALRRPLQRMAENGALPQTILLVDALDEARTYFSRPNILDLLARAHDFPSPVRFILLSRPEVDILGAFREVPVEVIHAESEENRRDVTAYLHREWEENPALRQAVQAWDAEWDADTFAARLGERSEWNFLYLRGVLPLIARGEMPDPTKLPAGLHGFHEYLLRTRIGEQEWRAWGADLLETMLAVQEPATLEHLARLLGWEARLTHQRLLRISELLDPAALKQDRYWRYHWSLAEFVADRQSAGIWWCDLPAAHRRIVHHYLNKWGGLEQGLPGLRQRKTRRTDEGYGLRHLGAHLLAGGETETLRRLLTLEDEGRNLWFTVQEGEGQSAVFLEDVRRLWAWARTEDARAAAQGNKAPHLGTEIRCALIEASLHSLAGNIPPALLAALVEKGVWTPAQGLAYARQVPNPRQQAETLEKLAPHLPPDLLAQALATAREIGDADDRARILTALGERLPEVWPEALAAAREIESEWYRALALTALTERLPPELLPEALAAAREIKSEWERAEVLTSLAARLPEVWPEALAAAREIRRTDDRARALTALAERLPEVLPEALAATREIGDADDRARALAALAPHLPPDLLPEALATGREIRDAYDRAEALAALAPHLPPEQQPQVLAEALAAAREIDESWRAWALMFTAREIQWKRVRAEVLAALVPHLLPEQQPQVLAEALATAKEIGDADDRARALAALAPHLPPDLLPEALAAARETDESWSAWALAALASRLAKLGYPQKALAAAREIQWKRVRAEALVALAPHLPPDLMPQALATAKEIGDADDRAEALTALAERLPPELLPEALAAAREIQWKRVRAEALAALAPHLPPEQQSQVLAEALATGREIGDARDRAKALAALAPHLPPEQQPQVLGEALAAARGIWRAEDRARALAALAPRLAELPRPDLYPLWDETLPRLARRTRPDLLADLRALVPVIHALGGEAAIAETARAIQDTARWWP